MEKNMYLGDSGRKLPDWYRIERDTEKIVGRLTSARELAGYLTNPDEFVRRIAIKRLGELKLKDSVPILQEIVDDRLEARANVELAAWSLKGVLRRWGVDLFTSARVLDRYTGDERFENIFGARFTDSSLGIRLGKEALSVFPEIKREDFNLKPSQDIMPDTQFPVKEWLHSFASNMVVALGRLPLIILKLPANAVNGFKNLKANHSAKPHKIKKVSNTYGKDWYSPYNCSTDWRKREFAPIRYIKALFRGIYRVTTFPFRLLYRYRLPVLLFIVSAYLILSATPVGKWTVYRYSGVDLSQLNSTIISSLGEITSYALNEARDLAMVTPQPEKNYPGTINVDDETRPQEQQNDPKTYSITARSGLNLRKSPDPSSVKVTETVLPYNSVVSYLSQSKKDASGRTWLLVRSPEGKEGWVSSKWLEEVGDR